MRRWHWQRVRLCNKASPTVYFLSVDLDDWRPPPAAFDCVTCFYFLSRELWPWLRAAVRPGGLLALQTHHAGVLTVRPAPTQTICWRRASWRR
jgi:hypothetical protein